MGPFSSDELSSPSASPSSSCLTLKPAKALPLSASTCTLCNGEVTFLKYRRASAFTGEQQRRRSTRNSVTNGTLLNCQTTPTTDDVTAECTTSPDGEGSQELNVTPSGARCPVCDRVYHIDCGDLRPIGFETREALGIRGISYLCGMCRKRRQEAYRLATTGNKTVPVGPGYQAPNIPKLWCQTSGEWKRGHPMAQPRCVWNPKVARSYGLTEEDIDGFLAMAEDAWPAQAIVYTRKSTRKPQTPELGSRQSNRLQVSRGEVSLEYQLPFSTDTALGVLHLARYDCEKALQLLNCPEFYTPRGERPIDNRPPRQSIMVDKLDLPTKPYSNKWRPKDKRERISAIPYPLKYSRLLPTSPQSKNKSSVTDSQYRRHL